METAQSPTLSPEEVLGFHRDGFVGPFTLMQADEIAPLRAECERVHDGWDLARGGGHRSQIHNRHFDVPAVWRLASHPELVGRMAALLGDVLLWRTHFFTKGPGAKEIPWHQDYNYWPIEPAVIVSAWIALDEIGPDNAPIEFVPGSHRRPVRHVKSADSMQFAEMADPSLIDTSDKVTMTMRPGQAVIFTERTLHHSDPNTSDRRRMALAVRCIHPVVRVLEYDADDHGVVLLAGEDRMRFNRARPAPAVA